MAKFILHSSTNGYRFNLLAENSQVILTSEIYTTSAMCRNGIQSVRNHCGNDAYYERLTARNGQYYFNLKASNGEVIGTSEMYTSSTARENGIASVKANAPGAEVVVR